MAGMLHVSTWYWGGKYGPDYVSLLENGVARHLRQPYRWRVFSPDPEDEYLMRIPGCFARLRAFDPAWQAEQGIAPGDRIVTLDLDLIVTGDLGPLFDIADDFAILQGANAVNPCPYNGSVWMLRAGAHAEMWNEFSLEAAARVPFYAFPDDQAWMAHKLPSAKAWKVGPESGIYAFKKRCWPKGDELPTDARIVAFPGWRDPVQFTHLPWVRKHWQ
jgi:hypothetical protein